MGIINTTRQKLHNFLTVRLNHAINPLVQKLEAVQGEQHISHIQTMQLLKAIANRLDPHLLDEFEGTGIGTALATGDVVISPNYAKRLHPDDVFLVSYPRSGNTWMRTIVAYLLYPADILKTLKDLEVYVPDLHHNLPHHHQYSQPRVLKTHEPYFNRQGLEVDSLYGKFIYVVRHPYKTLNSYYDLESFSPPTFMPIGEFVNRVLSNAYTYGGWSEHVQSWRYASKHAQALFLRYEDLQKSPIIHIQQIAQFLGKPVNEEQAEQVRWLSSQENMRELENRDPHLPGYENIRQGEERKTKQTLDSTLKAQIYEACQKQMDAFGYLADGGIAQEYPLKGQHRIP